MLRTWPALFAFGAGLLHLAAGAAVVHGGGASTAAVLCALIVVGAAELIWAGASLHAGRPRRPRLAVGAAAAAPVWGAAALAVGCSPIAIAAASGFAVTAGAMTARGWGERARRAASGGSAARRAHPAVAWTIAGALVVAAVATPALATTTAGLSAVHDHGGSTDPHGH
ncbi:hypothetical protein ACFQRL_10795 [Microbacterium fluvii]|uniref:Integral membrane protein n=1 Tax=Microbacterium fluvii TaxID=415215 RepID=A0ABW2HHY8_9MICO|nr:hypothetical protein [Microbacterium fluvii]MCU4673081.1 hypothetical protein [Microbacterium fluvii]